MIATFIIRVLPTKHALTAVLKLNGNIYFLRANLEHYTGGSAARIFLTTSSTVHDVTSSFS